MLFFASGDYGFNLYWQSMMLYLLFYYTEALHLPITTAAWLYAIASVWDGVISLAIGLWVDRVPVVGRHCRTFMIGTIPLGLSFVLAYMPVPLTGNGILWWVLGTHIALRSFYALVNIPYLAMSARISTNEGDRALVAGVRMLSGTLAAMTVALGTVPLGQWLTGEQGAAAYSGAAVLFAIVATVLLIFVGLNYRDGMEDAHKAPATLPLLVTIMAVLRNRAFLVLAGAMSAMIVAVTMVDKSVLYYFKYALGDEQAGHLALGLMMAVSGLAIPLCLLFTRRFGARRLWFAAAALGAVNLLLFVFGDMSIVASAQIFLVVMQVAIVGQSFVLWALLPRTIDHGERNLGVRADAATYGLVALLQRLGIGMGTLMLGYILGHEGLKNSFAHTIASETGLRLGIALVPLFFFLLAGLIMLAYPVRGAGRDDRHPADAPAVSRPEA
nr:MFS transporter [Stakelama sediminis]